MEPRGYAELAERAPALPDGAEERFAGYGVMGLPFASGHLLAMRRFPATSVGPGYTSVWHRDPAGAWTFYTDVEPLQSCNRYFGSDVDKTIVGAIDVDWTGPRTFVIRVKDADVEWESALASTLATRILNLMGRLLPDRLWKQPLVLSAMGAMAGPALRAGRLGMRGVAPNGQRFVANPRLVWTIASSRATIRGESLGSPGPLASQARLGDFWIPQRGLFVVGRAFFEPFDADRHLATASRGARRAWGNIPQR